MNYLMKDTTIKTFNVQCSIQHLAEPTTHNRSVRNAKIISQVIMAQVHIEPQGKYYFFSPCAASVTHAHASDVYLTREETRAQ